MLSITPEDLLLYLYQETSTERTAEIKSALETDWMLREKYEAISAGKKRLDTLNFSPRSKTIDNILQYAEKSVEVLSDHA